MANIRYDTPAHTRLNSPAALCGTEGLATLLGEPLRHPLWTPIGQQHVCVCVRERESAAWACGSAWVVMTWFAQLTAHILNCTCHVINLFGGEAEKVNKKGKVRRAGDGVRVCVRYYVLRWFYAEVYHILELSCNKQVEGEAKRFFAGTWPKQTSGCEFQKERLWGLHFIIIFLSYFPKLLTGKNSCVYLPRLPCNEVKLFSNLTDDGII